MLLKLVPSIEDNAQSTLDFTPNISRSSGTYYHLVAGVFFSQRASTAFHCKYKPQSVMGLD